MQRKMLRHFNKPNYMSWGLHFSCRRMSSRLQAGTGSAFCPSLNLLFGDTSHGNPVPHDMNRTCPSRLRPLAETAAYLKIYACLRSALLLSLVIQCSPACLRFRNLKSLAEDV